MGFTKPSCEKETRCVSTMLVDESLHLMLARLRSGKGPYYNVEASHREMYFFSVNPSKFDRNVMIMVFLV